MTNNHTGRAIVTGGKPRYPLWNKIHATSYLFIIGAGVGGGGK